MLDNWDSDVVTFNPTVIDESKRIIEGVATAPIFDRQNELITSDAIKKAIPDYMVLPVLTVQHKEFVAGLVKKAWFDESDRLHIKAQIKNTRELDRVWELIKSGELNSFSISGTRNATTCSIYQSNNPCVTSDISLNAITICGNNAINPEAFFDVVEKSTGDTEMVEEVKTTEASPAPEQPQVDNMGLAKALIAELRESGMLVTPDLSKSCEEEKKEEKEDKEEKDEYKKALEAQTEVIETLKKSLEEMTEKITTLSKAVEKIENEPIQKAAFTVKEGMLIQVPLNEMQKAESPKTTAQYEELTPYRAAYMKMRSE